MFTDTLVKSLTSLTGQKLIFPFYHTICDTPLPHLQHLYPVKSLASFEKDLIFLLRNYKAIDAQQLLDNQYINKRSFHLSFDDGFSGLYYHVAPLLKKYGVPASFFVSSAFIDNRDLMFRCKASLIIQNLSKIKSNYNLIKDFSIILGTSSNIQSINKAILDINYTKRELLDLLAKRIGLNIDEFLKIEKPYLLKEQIIELANDGFTIGSHSYDHPMFADLEQNEQVMQVKYSLEEIHSLIDQKLRLFSFPFSDEKVSLSFFQQVQRDVFPSLKLSFGTAGIKEDSIPCHFQRIAAEYRNWPLSCIIDYQHIKYIAKSPILRNRIERV